MEYIMTHSVVQSDRLKVTEKIIKSVTAAKVLELGSAEYSYKYCSNFNTTNWISVDMAKPCDIICDLNSEKTILPFEVGTFDLIICTEVLEHLLWPQNMLKEIHRVLASNGKILISVPNITSFTYRIAWLIGHVPSCAASANLPPIIGSTSYEKQDGSLIGGHVVDFSKKKIVALLRYTGFKTVLLEGSGIFFHKQILPSFLVPVSIASNIICLAEKDD